VSFSCSWFILTYLSSFPRSITLPDPHMALHAHLRGHVLSPEGVLMGRDVTVSPELEKSAVLDTRDEVEADINTGLDAEMDVDMVADAVVDANEVGDDGGGIDMDEEIVAAMEAEMELSDENVQLFERSDLAEIGLMRALAHQRGESGDDSDVSEFDEEKAYGDLIETVVVSSDPPVAGPSTQVIPTPRRRGGKGMYFLFI
jgi:hypothetical protein